MIFEQLFYDNFCDNFFSDTHIVFILFLSIVLVFCVNTYLSLYILVVS